MRKIMNNDGKIILIILIFIFVSSFSLGALFFNMVFSKLNRGNSVQMDNAYEVSNPVHIEDHNFKQGEDYEEILTTKTLYGIQCGVFKNDEYAKELYEELKEFGIPFIVEDFEYYRVIFGIFPDELSEVLMKSLDENGFEVSKFEIATDIKSVDQEIKYEIDLGVLKLIWRMVNRNLENSSTESYKNWVKNQKYDDSLESGLAAKRALALPNEISINDSEEILKKFYKEYKNNK
ncbi:SPOR domain-containing protein [Oceanirhabdus sp. W0125-5]|uniref:SPOR domain-containing protein n=1 Tax=Oceanirhabdus sp. W0125-5 TaxID=2999116 RepID=UPI0022F2F23F|nr:SPOR domain-containing protein [Oceanirhabdus sp. W0125-5]WBW95871.1 SPOR domain-containing protein [Oceanirhabdus sp. W0125-5]